MLAHITTRDAWQRAQEQGAYSPSSLKSEGFVRCLWSGGGSSGQLQLLGVPLTAAGRYRPRDLFEKPLVREFTDGLQPHLLERGFWKCFRWS